MQVARKSNERHSMSIFDKFKKKTGDLAEEHGDKAEDAIDRGAEFIDDKTGGKHTDQTGGKHTNQIEGGGERAKDFIGDLADDE